MIETGRTRWVDQFSRCSRKVIFDLALLSLCWLLLAIVNQCYFFTLPNCMHALQVREVSNQDSNVATFVVELYDTSSGQDVLVAAELSKSGHGKLLPSALSFLVS